MEVMRMATESERRYSIEHLRHGSTRYYILVGALILVTLLTIEAVVHQTRNSLLVTDLANQGQQAGVPWGLYIGTFEFVAGMAVGALAVAGYIRFYELDEYALIARIGTIWANICGFTAAFLIVMDLGTPHRILWVLRNWRYTVLQSPLAWDVTFVVTLLVFTVTMLVLTLRRDFLGTSNADLPIQTRVVKRIVSIGATTDEASKLDSMIRWMGLGLLVLAFTGGMVPGLLIGVVGGQPGYFGSIRGVMFLAAGLISGVALLALTATALRSVYGWTDFLSETVFTGLSYGLAVFGFVYLVIYFNDIIPIITQMSPYFEQRIGEALIFGSLSPLFWLSILLVAIPTVYLIFSPNRNEPRVIAVAAIMILPGVWIKSLLTIIEPLLFPILPYPGGTYSPTIVEWVITLGTLGVAVLAFLIVLKILPLTGRIRSQEVMNE